VPVIRARAAKPVARTGGKLKSAEGLTIAQRSVHNALLVDCGHPAALLQRIETATDKENPCPWRKAV
jgi:hypothetical protein